MRNIFLVIGILVSSAIYAPQSFAKQNTIKTNYQGLTEIVEINGKNKDQIFEDSRVWIAKNFNSANDVIQYADKSSGQIIAKGITGLTCLPEMGKLQCMGYSSIRFAFTLIIDVKDNKARLKVENVHYIQNVNAGVREEIEKRMAESQFTQLIKQYRDDLNQSSKSVDW
ncbi:DUF4468 domain-containing protein [Acinetobacter guillouiae]|uniref:DUF4468 domain-containing protein n=1 Tax=Acinetobacter guillouiae TaxID=106649 RepID=UPI003AF54014